jgi:hypothetical protein
METKTIYHALLEAQKKIEPVTKDANNPFYKKSYASLGSVIESVKPALLENGITISQPVRGDKVVTVITYIDGTMIADEGTPIICSKPNDPQAQGSSITYARRYGLMALLCLSTEDDDGEKATVHATTPPKTNELVREATTTPETCDHDWETLPLLIVQKEGPNKNRRFRSCPKCNAFRWEETIK